eukprot:jgi/Astpho2/4784/fgenesh1_pg.00067_%23_229_t
MAGPEASPNNEKIRLLAVDRVLQGDKHIMTHQLSIPYRDLRVLDPQVPIPYPSAIFIREKALVVNLETIRMIIGEADSGDDHVRSFGSQRCVPPIVKEAHLVHVDRTLPYELRALEGALHNAVGRLELEVLSLEDRINTGLRQLDVRVSRHGLEKVQGGKVVLNKLLNRMARLKTVLEKILDDDHDMDDMYLGRRAEQAAAEEAETAAFAAAEAAEQAELTAELAELAAEEAECVAEEAAQAKSAMQLAASPLPGARLQSAPPAADSPQPAPLDPADRAVPSSIRAVRASDPRSPKTPKKRVSMVDLSKTERILDRVSMGGRSESFLQEEVPTLAWTKAGNVSLVNPRHIEGCESLLETYFMQLLTIVATAIAFVGAVGSLFGMNLYFCVHPSPLVAQLHMERALLQQQSEQAKSEVEAILASRSCQVQAAETMQLQLQQQLKEQQAQCAKLLKQLAGQTELVDAVEGEIQALRAEMVGVRHTVEQSGATGKEHQSRLQAIVVPEEKLIGQLEEQKQRMSGLQHELHTSRSQLASSCLEGQQLQEELQASKQQVEHLGDELAQSKQVLSEVQGRERALAEQLEELQEATTTTHAAVTAACEDLTAQLQSKVSPLSITDRQLRVQIGMTVAKPEANTNRPAVTGPYHGSMRAPVGSSNLLEGPDLASEPGGTHARQGHLAGDVNRRQEIGDDPAAETGSALRSPRSDLFACFGDLGSEDNDEETSQPQSQPEHSAAPVEESQALQAFQCQSCQPARVQKGKRNCNGHRKR